MAELLSTEVSVSAERVVVRVLGEIDLATAPRLRRVLDGAVDRAVAAGTELVLVDFGGVDFFDLHGLHAVEDAWSRGEEMGCRVLVGPESPSVSLLLEITGAALPRARPAPELRPLLERAVRAAGVPIGIALSVGGGDIAVDSYVGTDDDFVHELASVVTAVAATGRWPAPPTGLWIGDVSKVPGAAAAPEGRVLLARGIRAVCTRAVHRDGRLVGLLLLYDREPRDWSPEVRRAVERSVDGG